MRQSHGEDVAIDHGATVPSSDTDGTDLVTAFRQALRYRRCLLSITTGAGTVSVDPYLRTRRGGGLWGSYQVDGLTGVTLAASKTYHFVVDHVGGFDRMKLVTTGTALAGAYLTEIVD